MKQTRLLFIDRDGTLIQEPEDEQIDSFEKLVFTKGVFRNLAFIAQHTDYEDWVPTPFRKIPSGLYTTSSSRPWRAKASTLPSSTSTATSLRITRRCASQEQAC